MDLHTERKMSDSLLCNKCNGASLKEILPNLELRIKNFRNPVPFLKEKNTQKPPPQTNALCSKVLLFPQLFKKAVGSE